MLAAKGMSRELKQSSEIFICAPREREFRPPRVELTASFPVRFRF